MATDNTTQINDFSGGMNTDTSDMSLNKNTYRMAKNLRYTTNTLHNSTELHMIESAAQVLDESGNQIHFDNVIDSTQLRDLGIVVTGNEEGWQVYTYKENRIPCIQCVANISDTSRVIGAKKLSLVTKYENDKNQKLYIADGLGPILSILLITDSPVEDLNSISAYSPTTFTVPVFCGLINGAIKAPVVEYSYQLYNKYGNQSEISPSTKLIQLRTGATTVANSKKIQGFKLGATADKGVRIKIQIVDTTFEYIKVYRISYVENGLLPTIDLIYDEKLKDRELYINDIGGDSLGTLTLEEYNSMSGIHIIPKTIESKDGYMFAANIKTDKGSINNSSILFDNYNSVAYSYRLNSTEKAPDVNPYCDINKEYKFTDEDAYAFLPNSNVLGGLGENVSWKFISTNVVGEYNDDVDYINVLNKTSNTDAFSTTTLKQELVYDDSVGRIVYTKKEGESIDLSTFIEASDDSFTYANTLVSYSLKSLRRGELYRYGIILYDNEGNNSQVKWVADIRVPSITLARSFYKLDSTLIVKPIGIEFEVRNLPENVVSYEIVRCARQSSDISIVSQGVIARPVRRWANSRNTDGAGYEYVYTTEYPYTPTGWLTINDYTSFAYANYASEWFATNTTDNALKDIWAGVAEDEDYNTFLLKEYNMSNTSLFLFVSPEICYAQDDFLDVISKLQLSLQKIQYLYPQYQDTPSDFENVYMDNFLREDLGFYWKFFGNKYTHLILKENEIVMPNAVSTADDYSNPALSSPVFLAYYFWSGIDITGGGKDLSTWRAVFDKSRRNAYVKLYNQVLIAEAGDKISNISVAQDLSWNDYADGNSPESVVTKYQDKVTVIGTDSYVNWVCGGGFGTNPTDVIDSNSSIDDLHQFMMGPGGKCAVLKLGGEHSLITYPEYPIGTYLCNIRRTVVPYGGYDEAARSLSVYRSFGNYFESTTNTVQVFDGDTYIMPFENISQHKWTHPLVPYGRSACIVYSIPVETNINLALTDGYEFSKNYKTAGEDISYILLEPSSVSEHFVLSEPLYSYNTAYSSLSQAKIHSANNEKDDDLDEGTDFRVYHSLLKSDNEFTDSWLKFLSANYLDVDSRYGPITGLRRFNNQLIFWQENATGILSVNERTTITDDSGLPLILGTGDVLARYDYIATSNGMKEDEYSDAQSDAVLYWWDHNKHEICQYQGGQNAVVLSKIKFVLNYLNNMYDINRLSERPLLIFDKEFNELISKVDVEQSLIYNEYTGQYTGVYSITPLSKIQFADRTLMFGENGKLYRWNVHKDFVTGLNDEPLLPYLKYTVNNQAIYTKVFDNGELAGRIYGGEKDALEHLRLTFKTPLKQEGILTGDKITNREYNFRYVIPRNKAAAYGDRLRGKTMECELESDSNSYDFSLQFITNKYRISWS